MKNEREYIGKTTLLYEQDAYLKEFTTTVLECFEDAEKHRFGIILKETAFFPEGGGQSADAGTLNEMQVLDVQSREGDVIHYVDNPLEVGATVTGELDWSVRFRKMQNHSGEHLFCGLIHNLYGYENVGFHMDENAVTLDVNGPLALEDIERIEKLTNENITCGLAITASFPNEEEARTLEYRSKLELTEGIRLVTIEGVDVCACCAPHVRNTAEIGMVHVLDFMPHRGGTRITLIAGGAAYEDYKKISDNNGTIVKLLSAKRYETGKMTEGLFERNQALQKELSEYKAMVTSMTIEKVKEQISGREEGDFTPELIFAPALDGQQLRNLINECKEGKNYVLIGFRGNEEAGYDYIASGEGENLPELAKAMNAALSGRGGGNQQMIQGHVNCGQDSIRAYFAK